MTTSGQGLTKTVRRQGAQRNIGNSNSILSFNIPSAMRGIFRSEASQRVLYSFEVRVARRTSC